MLATSRTVATLVLAILGLAAVQSVQAQYEWTPNNSVTFIELLDVTINPATRDKAPNDTGLLDVYFGFRTARTYYTTDGRVIGQVRPGNLRAVDIDLPLPDLVPLDGFDGIGWNAPGTDWTILDAVEKWNDALDGAGGPTDPDEGKGSSERGLIAMNGRLFVPVRHKNSVSAVGTPWNGLAKVQGNAPPSTAFNGTSDELYSTDTPGDEAAPQGSAIAATQSGDSYLFVPNYEGSDAAGFLRVQVVTTPAVTTAANSFSIDVYELLASYIPGAPTAGSSALLGPEVPTNYFWQSTPTPGQKLRAVCTVHVPKNSGLPNEDRTLLFLGLNLDPVFPVQEVPLGFYHVMDKSPGWLMGPGSTADDGKYDYIGIIDITDMAHVPRGGTNEWSYDAQVEWADRMRFLRLPPDLPPGWMWPPDSSCFSYSRVDDVPPESFNACFNDEGFDWGMVQVHLPETMVDIAPWQLNCYGQEPPTFDTAVPVIVVGSGTLASITAHPDNTWVYVLSTDENADAFMLKPCAPPLADPDGGWHIPHLYGLDLSAGDFTSQTFLDGYTPFVENRRFNKIVAGCLTCEDTVTSEVLQIPSYQRVHDADFVLEGLPGTAGVIPSIITPWNVPSDGLEYPGENFLEPTARTRLLAVRNLNMTQDPSRLYVGINGWTFEYQLFQFDWMIPVPAEKVGAFFSAALPSSSPGSPSYRRTITIPQVDDYTGFVFPRYFRVGGVASLPGRPQLIGIPDPGTGILVPNSLKRNILIAIANDTTREFTPTPEDLQDRLVLIQDRQDL